MRLFTFVEVILLWVSSGLTVRSDQRVSLAWDASPGPNIIGYNLYSKDASGNNFRILNVTNGTTVSVSGLKEGTTNTFVVTAYDGNGLESEPSTALTYIVPGVVQITLPRHANEGVRLRFPVIPGREYEIQASSDLNSWTRIWSTNATANVWIEYQDTDTAAFQKRFYRVVPR